MSSGRIGVVAMPRRAFDEMVAHFLPRLDFHDEADDAINAGVLTEWIGLLRRGGSQPYLHQVEYFDAWNGGWHSDDRLLAYDPSARSISAGNWGIACTGPSLDRLGVAAAMRRAVRDGDYQYEEDRYWLQAVGDGLTAWDKNVTERGVVVYGCDFGGSILDEEIEATAAMGFAEFFQ